MANVTCWLLRPQFTRVPEFPHKKVDRIGYVSKFCVRDFWDVSLDDSCTKEKRKDMFQFG